MDNKTKKEGVELINFEMVDARTFSGLVQVDNISEEKSVFARVSINHWESWCDILAKHVGTELSSEVERREIFEFQFQRPATRYTDIEFAVCCQRPNCELWDNNNDNNYAFRNLPAELPEPSEIKEFGRNDTHEVKQNREACYIRRNANENFSLATQFDAFLDILEESVRE